MSADDRDHPLVDAPISAELRAAAREVEELELSVEAFIASAPTSPVTLTNEARCALGQALLVATKRRDAQAMADRLAMERAVLDPLERVLRDVIARNRATGSASVEIRWTDPDPHPLREATGYRDNPRSPPVQDRPARAAWRVWAWIARIIRRPFLRLLAPRRR